MKIFLIFHLAYKKQLAQFHGKERILVINRYHTWGVYLTGLINDFNFKKLKKRVLSILEETQKTR